MKRGFLCYRALPSSCCLAREQSSVSLSAHDENLSSAHTRASAAPSRGQAKLHCGPLSVVQRFHSSLLSSTKPAFFFFFFFFPLKRFGFLALLFLLAFAGLAFFCSSAVAPRPRHAHQPSCATEQSNNVVIGTTKS